LFCLKKLKSLYKSGTYAEQKTMSSNNAFRSNKIAPSSTLTMSNAFRSNNKKSAPSLTKTNFPELSVSVSNVAKPSLTHWASIAAMRVKPVLVTVEEFSQQPSYAKMISNPFDYAKWYNGMHREVGYDDYFSEAYLESNEECDY